MEKAINRNIQNPWKGLQPYDDNVEDLTYHPFCGREIAGHEIFALIDDNITTTLYGKSGIGKTSLLKAGVFPLLRNNGYLPIYVRLNIRMLTNNDTYADVIVNEIRKRCNTECITISQKKNVESSSETSDFLWEFFAVTEFRNAEGNVVFPVIILDQFEEIFNDNTEEKAVKLLLHQLRELMNENKLYGSTAPIINYRFVISLREDDLFLLEEAIDVYHVEGLKLNRYRLKSLNLEEAKDIIEIGNDYIEESNKEEIVRIILEKSTYKDTHTISTDMLSLTCSQLFIQTQGNITLEALKQLNDSLLENFYLKSISLVSPVAKEFIEEKLEKDARRTIISESSLKDCLTQEEYDLLSKGEHKILHYITIDSVKYVELIHDSLSQAIFSLKKKKAEMKQIALLKEKKRKLNFRLWIFIPTILVLLISIIIYLINANQELKDTRGLGIKQEFLIAFSQDSAVVADNEFWKAKFRIVGIRNNGLKDTLLMDTIINKGFRDSTLRFEAIDVESFVISLDFRNMQNRNFYKSQEIKKTLSYFTTNKELKIKIEYDETKMVSYKGTVMMDIGEKNIYRMEKAIVILGDKVIRTNSNGDFTFIFKDSLQKNQLITIVRPGLASVEECFFKKDKQKEIFILTPTDSLSAFREKCMEMDSIKTWDYAVVSKYNITNKNGKKDRLVFFANKKKGVKENGNSIIWGYYYLQNEYNAYDENKKYLSYHLFTGWMNSTNQSRKDAPMYKLFEVTSTDKVGNEHILEGCRKKTNGMITGQISNVDGIFAKFGNDKDYQEFQKLIKH